MAKIVLISCNIAREPYPVYPLGLSMVAAASRAKGHEVYEWDLLINKGDFEKGADFVKEHQPDVIGLSLRNIDSVNYNEQKSYIDGYKTMTLALKKVSTAPIVLGGAAFTIMPEAILKEIRADYGIAGEGEDSFCYLVDELENGRSPNHKIIKADMLMPKELLKPTERNPEFTEFYLKKGGMLNIQTKRGCPHRCAYCSYPVLEGRIYRCRSKDEVVDEIEMLVKKHHADYYSITDSVFNDATNHYLEIAEELVRRKINTPWMCFLRPDKFKQEEVDLLKRAGLTSIEWGTDCSTDTTLAEMQKDFTWEDVIHANNIFSKAGLSSAHFIIFGGPGETQKTVTDGLKNISKLENSVVFASLGVRIFPQTHIHRRALQEHYISEKDDLIKPVFYFSEQSDPKIMHNSILDSFQGRMDRIYPDGQLLEKTSAFHLFGYRGPIWDYILKKGQTRRGKN